MCGGAATNLAAATGKIPITVVTVRFLIIEMAVIHESDLFTSLRRKLSLISANILTESDAVLLEEIMIVQGGTVFESMLSSTRDAMLRPCHTWILFDCQCHLATTVASEHVVGSFISIRNFNL